MNRRKMPSPSSARLTRRHLPWGDKKKHSPVASEKHNQRNMNGNLGISETEDVNFSTIVHHAKSTGGLPNHPEHTSVSDSTSGSPNGVTSRLSFLSSRILPSSYWGGIGASKIQSIPEEETPDENYDRDDESAIGPSNQESAPASPLSPASPPVSLEGTLLFRKCRTSDNLKSWRQAYVVFDMRNGGSLSCYKQKPSPVTLGKSGTSQRWGSRRLQRIPSSMLSETTSSRNINQSMMNPVLSDGVDQPAGSSRLQDDTDSFARIRLPSYVNWVAKDIQHNSSGFVIEISSDEPFLPFAPLTPDEGTFPEAEEVGSGSLLRNRETSKGDPFVQLQHATSLPDDIEDDVRRAKERGQAFRIYFKCSRSGQNEKVLWLRAFEQADRLSFDLHRQRALRNAFGSPTLKISHSRTRSRMGRIFALEGQALDADRNEIHIHSDDESFEFSGDGADSVHDDASVRLQERTKGVRRDNKEHLVYPVYAYPNRWMTDSELYTEMMKPSDEFHDLRLWQPDTDHHEIGQMKVEVLQCVGLPPLDFASETDAVVYLVCGSYAFTTDVIWNRLNPMWLPRTRRACLFPLFHAYAQLYVGVFDDDGKGEKDDFAGRVVLDLARLRPGSTFDVTLPIRLSNHVYSKQPRGSIRLRFSIEYHSERDALLSYIPKTMPSFSTNRKYNDTTVVCADEKAFRNIVTTVHGIHMPGRFSFAEWRSTMREMNFARKVALNAVRDLVFDIVKWKNPALSLLIFCAWMHCIYKNAFSLVPLYGMSFFLLMMMRTYVLYGSDGPIQNGFIPPSWEEMFLILAKGGKTKRIEPLKLKVRQPSKPSPRTNQTARRLTEVRPQTHKQRGQWLFRLLGFHSSMDGDAVPEDYHMEFPYAQALRNPLTNKPHYPRLTVKESLVSKTTRMHRKRNKKRTQDDEGDNILGDMMISTAESATGKLMETAVSASSKFPKRKTIGFLSKVKDKDSSERRSSFPPDKLPSSAAPRLQGSKLCLSRGTAEMKPDTTTVENARLPPRLRFPEQNSDEKGPATKKKLGDELTELRDNMHKLTGHVFNDRTHLVRRDDATFFGQSKGGRNINNELERLLNIGQYSSPNPVIARVGLYVEPLISAAHSGLCLTRAVYNIITWRDPILSFWVSLLLMGVVLILAIFPWRLFLFVTGCLVVGPQNYLLRVMDERGTAPKFIKDFMEKRANAQKKQSHVPGRGEIRKDQPVISSHTSDNLPPPMLLPEEVDPRVVHEVSVPYSQLMYHRMYDWPPEPQYARCVPNKSLRPPAPRRIGFSGVNNRSRHTYKSTSSIASESGHLPRRVNSTGTLSDVASFEG